ncbi:hypothetical protein BGW38_003033 [Lunasporangiospora selenospora]|uniref:Uncharacterized protein n=1 Tax=Lunasporangiospora selenospora TaxID=979761 RepID=A0A9P6FTA1_9FUNG|nr:hypothetical protein BGW38_003033 [Lunasporangiospora selenospora]
MLVPPSALRPGEEDSINSRCMGGGRFSAVVHVKGCYTSSWDYLSTPSIHDKDFVAYSETTRGHGQGVVQHF